MSLKEIAKHLKQIQIDLAEIKIDLAHHIKRSDAHESDIEHLKKVKYMIYGAVTLLTLIATLSGMYGIFK